jgi:hypothetical protein
MGKQRGNVWEDNEETYYTPGQVEGVLSACNIEVESETVDHYLCYCPFHGNSDTTAMAVNMTTGKWICFNPACNEHGELLDLPRRLLKMTVFAAMRLVLKYKTEDPVSFAERIAARLQQPVEFPPWPQEVFDKMRDAFPGSPAEDYMHGRGFTDDTLDHFGVGYSEKKNQVIVPMHDPKGNPIGLVGRTLPPAAKRFENSRKLQKSKTLWNFHRAKAAGDTLLITESTFDSMRVHQAGYPCTAAVLGGTLSDWHVDQINRYFTRVIILTDYDSKLIYRPNCKHCAKLDFGRDSVRCQGHRTGRDLGRKIGAALPTKDVLWGAYSDDVVYPHDAKDMSDLTDEEIRMTVRNSVSNLTYRTWNPEQLRVA